MKLLNFNVPNDILDIVFSRNNNDIAKINEILEDKLINFFIELYLNYKPLLHTFYHKNTNIGVSTYIPEYFKDNIDIDLSNKKYRPNFGDQKKLLKNLTNSNTIYFYTLSNILNIIDSANCEKNYNKWIKSFQKLTKDYTKLLAYYSDDTYIQNNISIMIN